MITTSQKTSVPDKYKVHGNKVVWRYFSFDKFCQILLTKKILFTKANLFTDQREFTVQFKDNDPGSGKDVLAERDKIKEKTFVSCWSLETEESYALWRIYLADSKIGVAVKVRHKKLFDYLNAEEKEVKIEYGKVHYAKNIISVSETDLERAIICTKTPPYTYEKECRYFLTSDSDQNVIERKFDLEELGCRIYLSPFSSFWQKSLIRELIEKLSPKLKDLIVDSEINEKQ